MYTVQTQYSRLGKTSHPQYHFQNTPGISSLLQVTPRKHQTHLVAASSIYHFTQLDIAPSFFGVPFEGRLFPFPFPFAPLLLISLALMISAFS